VEFHLSGGATFAESRSIRIAARRTGILHRGGRHRHRDNPMIVADSCTGHRAGVGQALFGIASMTRPPPVLSSSFWTYCPARNMRTWRSVTRRRCARITSFGVKGCGEAHIGSPATGDHMRWFDALSHLVSVMSICRNAKPRFGASFTTAQSAARSRIGAGDEGLFIHKPSTVSRRSLCWRRAVKTGRFRWA